MNEFAKAAEFVKWQIESAIDPIHWNREVDQTSLDKMNTLAGSTVFQFVDDFRNRNQQVDPDLKLPDRSDSSRNVSFVWKDAVTGDVCDCPISYWEFDSDAKQWKNSGTNPNARKVAINAIEKWIRAIPADTATKNVIPPENRSRPLQKQEAATLYQQTVKWLSACMNEGTIEYEELSRQSYVFDVTKFPAESQSKARKA